MILPYSVYVLKSLKDGDLYTGFTANLPRRLEDHNSGKSPATAPRRPFILLFCEHYLSKSDALRRETYLKSTIGKRTLRLMLADALADSPPAAQHRRQLSPFSVPGDNPGDRRAFSGFEGRVRGDQGLIQLPVRSI